MEIIVARVKAAMVRKQFIHVSVEGQFVRFSMMMLRYLNISSSIVSDLLDKTSIKSSCRGNAAMFRYYSTAFLISCKLPDVRVHICPRRTGPRLISARGATLMMAAFRQYGVKPYYSNS